MSNYKKTCAFCKKTFHSQRKDAKTCSSTCRVYLHKLKSGSYENNKRFELTKNNVRNVNLNVSETFEEEKLNRFLLAHYKDIHKISDKLDLCCAEEYGELFSVGSYAVDMLVFLQKKYSFKEKHNTEVTELTNKFDEKYNQ